EGIGVADLAHWVQELLEIPGEITDQIERDALYSVYLDRQQADIEAMRRDEGEAIPVGFDYGALSGLSNELKAKLLRIQPRTLAEAGRIEGMTPAALVLILARLKQAERKRSAG
ncbi:MAG: tRNA uridine-5-carboxymethylaminomethyl(34) synthesis enzyme MnmG, partial [Paracoccaceae bacterium]|nr:tRNA uridine-5-carboxymethylaminomethyl(34) synthesis enzyme MnmG [Paracoccaceae bacterium]